MGKKYENKGCCPNSHAKCFEIILIIGFILSLAILIVNLILNLWCFKAYDIILAFNIIPIGLNGISAILSIILRLWRSDDSVFKNNFSSSSSVAYLLLVVVIINLLSSITGEVLYSFIYYFFYYDKKMEELAENGNWDQREKLEKKAQDNYKIVEKLVTKDIDVGQSKFEKLYKKAVDNSKIVEKLVTKDIDVGTEDPDKIENKYNILEILPWIALNFNNLIQFIMIIFIIILIGRIKLKNHFGFPQDDKNQSANYKINDNGEIDEKSKKKKKKKKKDKEVNDMDASIAGSDATKLKSKKKKNKKKKSSSKKKEIS